MICGHDREHLKLGLEMCNFFGNDALGMAGDKRHPYAVAIRDGHDPAKLAAIIAELMRERGIDAAARRESPARFYVFDRSSADRIVIRDRDSKDLSGPPGWLDLTLPQARAFAIALLDSPQATTQDIERMIGEL